MTAAYPSGQKSVSGEGIGYNMLAIALALVLVGLGFAYALDAAGRKAHAPAFTADGGPTLDRTVGGRQLDIPLSWFRHPEQRVEGFAKQIDLHLVLPLGPGNARRGIDVTLLPRSGVRPSARLLDGVYLHMFASEELQGPQGLIGKPLRPVEGYAAEAVWYDPLAVDPFVAKCSASVSGGTSRCLRAVHLAPGLAAVYAFDADVLNRWREFDASLHPLLARIGALDPS